MQDKLMNSGNLSPPDPAKFNSTSFTNKNKNKIDQSNEKYLL
jgi:hypothetical protein